MYLEYYRLEEPPFNVTPDPRFLYFSAKHQEAYNHLLFGIHQRKGFIALTGEVGAGKTTVCRRLLEELGPSCTTALILSPCLTATQLLRAIVTELDVLVRGANRLNCLQALNEFVLAQASEDHDVVVIIDEAQDLSNELLEQIRLLSNLETDNQKLMQIVLMGQPELRQILAQPQLRQLRQRITVHYHLGPLDLAETGAYIQHRLTLAGANGTPRFDDGAVKAVYAYSGGIPRLVNVACDKTLLAGFVRQTELLTKREVGLAVEELEGVLA
ncbi:AAA family ATPase [bacterium]|nr:AAA family ATPase [bacterium]